MEELDIIGPSDQPAILAINSPALAATARTTLSDMGYKVHVVDSHEAFAQRFNQINYQVVLMEETFAGSDFLDNATLRYLQNLPMNQRRHAAIILIGSSYETLNTMQAFALSVHCVINYSELSMLPELIQKTVAENDLFLTSFREAQRRLWRKPA